MPEGADLFPGFERRIVDTGEAAIFLRTGGSGPPVVLLHGFPQTHVAWHRVAPRLADRFTLVIPDLRGYGASSCPPAGPDHRGYSKRVMARDVVEVMRALGHERFALVGHDRGGRVGYRLALDSPDVLTRLAAVEIVPTFVMWERFSRTLALKAYHWAFLAQPEPFPERLLAGAAGYHFCDHTLASWTRSRDLSSFDPDALPHYRAVFEDPARIHAMCEDYRAGATCDYEADKADCHAGRRIACPLHVVHGGDGFPAATGDVAGIWREWAETVTVSPVVSGHFPQEENAEATAAALLDFLAGDAGG